MAENQGVWGIDIGQSGLKAIRLRYAEAADQVIAVAFDYVPHPKILSQPDAVPDELIRQALDTFLSRNQIGNDLVAISVPGQSALARFIQLPPVESSKVAEIVKYEARQQIPFALEEVIWDYQTIGGGTEESGYMLEAEVGLFAMKRDLVENQLRPYLERKVEVELIQIAPLALYNFLSFDRLGMRPGQEFTAPDDYTVILDMGADNTTLLISNGQKIWMRNVPIGGNHFTRALTKEMKLTFAKAEHLKCNATKSPDPRAVFQALRPVFNDYVSEIQRSIGFFSSVNRQAKIGRILGLGNGFKLAGLEKFLQQNLQHEVRRVESFQGVVGDHVLSAPLFQENILTFAVPYGLALQGLHLTRMRTTLLPPEIALERKIRRKKPWALVAAASLLFGVATSAAGFSHVLSTVSEERFGDAEKKAADHSSYVSGKDSAYKAETSKYAASLESGKKLVGVLEPRQYWLEVYKAINDSLPRDEGKNLDQSELTKMNRITLKSITAKRYSDLSTWFTTLTEREKAYMAESEKTARPTGEGYVFTLQGFHYHHGDDPQTEQGAAYVQHTLLSNLRKWTVERDGLQTPVRKIGITHAAMTKRSELIPVQYWPHGKPGTNNPLTATQGGFSQFGGRPQFPQPGMTRPMGRRPGVTGRAKPGTAKTKDELGEDMGPIKITRFDFTVQFAWKPTPIEQRAETDPAAPAAPAAPAEEGANPAAGGENPAPTANPVTPAT